MARMPADNPTNGKSGLPVSFADRPLWLLRGRDLTGRNDFKAGFESLSQPG